MIKGLAVAMRSVFFTLFLLVLLNYVFAITFKQLTEGMSIGNQYFPKVPDAMLTLLLSGTLLQEVQDAVTDMGRQSLFLGALFLVFILLAGITIMNMLIGVLCQVVNAVSSVEREQLTVTFVRGKMEKLLQDVGFLDDDRISKFEFESMLQRPEAAAALAEVGVDVVGLVDFTDSIFHGDVELTFPEFMDIVLSFRGCNQATVKDIVDLRKSMLMEFARFSESLGGAKMRHLHGASGDFVGAFGSPACTAARLLGPPCLSAGLRP